MAVCPGFLDRTKRPTTATGLNRQLNQILEKRSPFLREESNPGCRIRYAFPIRSIKKCNERIWGSVYYETRHFVTAALLPMEPKKLAAGYEPQKMTASIEPQRQLQSAPAPAKQPVAAGATNASPVDYDDIRSNF